jgi:hypothetical protein
MKLNTYTFKNSNLKKINSTSQTTSKLINIDAKIDTLNLDTPLSILSGEFETQINIINNCHLNLDDNFILTTAKINLINDNNEEKEIVFSGVLHLINNDLDIISDNNISIAFGISSTDKTDKVINLSVNPITNTNDFFKINSIDTQNNIPLPINLKSTNTQNIIIDANIKSFDIGESSHVNLIVSESSTINEFKNVTDETFDSVIASEEIVESLEKDSNIVVPLKSLLLKVKIKNGKGVFSLAKERTVSDRPQTNIILNSKRFSI